jgi:predicted ATPase/class 3 adenylate cyclase
VLPTGTVTLLFSDVEGSTALLSRLGSSYAELVDEQRALQRAAWVTHAGVELGTEGDSFYVVFPTATDGVAAAVEAQRELARTAWPGGAQVRVRMGLHSGSPSVHADAYIGMDVHRAARISAAAHGGQILVSAATAELVEDSLPQGARLSALGTHRLKDIPRPERLWQVVVDGIAYDFPPPRTIGRSSSLPLPATPLVGRAADIIELAAQLTSPEVRLVTVTGPGGTGKTRVAVAVAQRLVEDFPDGVYFVPLAPVNTAESMWSTIAETLDLPPEGRIPPGFFEHVRDRTALLVLDNLEQVVGADAVVTQLLDEAPQVVVLATSRRPLATPGQYVHPVPPLPLPDGGTVSEVAASEAVSLFVASAQRVKPGFALTEDNAAEVLTICRRLDGLPLALELAAARIRLLSPRALVARLSTLDLVGSTLAPSRQRTLRETIDWSYRLLPESQQVFFRHLGVFAGSADLAAVAAATGHTREDVDPLDLVADLVDVSLVLAPEDELGEPRVALLQTMRDFALARLTAHDELDAARDRHLQHYSLLAEDLHAVWFGPRHLEMVRRLEADLDNFREAIAWALDEPDGHALQRVLTGARLTRTFGYFAAERGYVAEAVRLRERALECSVMIPFPDELVYGLHSGLSWVLGIRGEFDRALAEGEAALEFAQKSQEPALVANAQKMVALAHLNLGDAESARPLLARSLEAVRELDDDLLLSDILSYSFALELDADDVAAQERLLAELHTVGSRLGDETMRVYTEVCEAQSLSKAGDPRGADARLSRVLSRVLDCDEPMLLADYADACIAAAAAPARTRVRLLGAVMATRKREVRPRSVLEERAMATAVADLRTAVGEEWETLYADGGLTTVEDCLRSLWPDNQAAGD